jgi:hypothetical protein
LLPFGEGRVVAVIYGLDDPLGDEADETPGAEGQEPNDDDLGQLSAPAPLASRRRNWRAAEGSREAKIDTAET